ncbi:hypothetical protein D9619_006766 [Psilocybe cf. subviscida]|uniref:Protein kinase domain-containing protein n=1 Tax=Psilocybe cf. subviscida TaxID=2480587 RepID=A0A8H5B407_9AGAR|nr:hypothetical protein D9619_006766 [Psilocybe cf. subviscida]
MITITQWLLSVLRCLGPYLSVRKQWSRLKSIKSSGKLQPEEFKLGPHKLLPLDIASWKSSIRSDTIRSVEIWDGLRPFFKNHGFSLWSSSKTDLFAVQRIDHMPSPNGYFYHNRHSLASYFLKPEWGPAHGAHHAARSGQGDDYIISVMAVGENDEKALNHLRIIRRLSATYPDILLSNNHILPLVQEIFYGDTVFGVFPMLKGISLYHCLLPNMPRRSVEDAVFLLLQALEAICYIHGKRIAHRDLFFENFLVEWIPESLVHPVATRPRVYLIDFETAVQFEDDVTPEAMVLDSNNLPFPEETYKREPAPELYLEDDYCPFKLDVWQFGHGLIECFTSTTIPEIDNLWPTLVVENPIERPTAAEVLQTLRSFINSTPPQRLHIPFDFVMIR